MKRLFPVIVFIFFVTSLQTPAQEITATLAGTGSSYGFSVNDNTPTTLFRVRGDGNVGIGTTTPQFTFHVQSTSGSPMSFLQAVSDAGDGGRLFLNRTRGTPSSISIVQDNDRLGQLAFSGYDGTVITPVGADIIALVDGTPSTSNMPTELLFRTSPGVGGTGVETRMLISKNGNVGIGTTTPFRPLSVEGTPTDEGGTIDGVYEAYGTIGNVMMGNGATIGYPIISPISSTYPLIFATFVSGTPYERVRIANDGNVGIGTTSPTAKVDVNGSTGYDQLRMRTSYTPTGTSDANGNTGDITWDDDYIYIKTGAGWKRVALSTF